MNTQPRVLVANRSEIACRVFQACRELGYRAVGLVAAGDEEARHVSYADELISIPSYLDIPSIVSAAKKARIDVVHPGYGFLSERSAFVRALDEAGIRFAGPTAETMDLMGGKIAAKEVAERAGVPTLPWARVPVGGDLRAAAKKVGFPLLLKASAGGGGKGMRRVDRAEELEMAAESAASEAMSAFGDGTLFLERLVESPRHIEVQVFGDGLGGGTHLYERECSLQRRHQKVWEEAPAPHLLPKTRDGLFQAAMNLVKEVKYRSAGTLEFLVNEAGDFFFLEMNTRLQVEHPVTEQVTGTDLVHAMLKLALHPPKASKDSPLTESFSPRGHAIEVAYAEDPSQDFRPTPGTVQKLRWPTGTGIRVESGIEEGQTVGTSFDSMLAKIIVHAPTRAQAVERMKFALDETVVLGMGTNQAFLRDLCDHEAVRAGHVDTGFLAREFGQYRPAPTETEMGWIAAVRAQARVAPEANAGASGASPWNHFSRGGVK